MGRLFRAKDAYSALSGALARVLVNELDDAYIVGAANGTPLEWDQKVVLIAEALHAFHCAASDLERAEQVEIPTPRRGVPEATRREVLERDGFHCLACGSNEDLSIDHVVPLERGGKHLASNFQTLCRSCNSAKGVEAVDYRLDAA